MKLVLIRHGATEANEKRLYCGKTDIGLSDKGIEQLKLLMSSVEYPAPGGIRILTSGMRRCEETLLTLYGNVEHEVDRRFSEMDLGIFEMHSYDELKEWPEYIEWISGDNESNIVPSGESGRLMKERVLEGLRDLISAGKDAILITHGGVISAIMAYLYPEENKNRYEWQPASGSGYVLDIPEHTYTVIGRNV